jgi:hypothetical protein
VFEAAAVDHGGDFGPGDKIEDLGEGVPILAYNDVDVRSADAESVDFAIEVGEHLAELLEVAVSADAFDVELLAEDFDFLGLVSLGASQGYGDNLFHACCGTLPFEVR